MQKPSTTIFIPFLCHGAALGALQAMFAAPHGWDRNVYQVRIRSGSREGSLIYSVTDGSSVHRLGRETTIRLCLWLLYRSAAAAGRPFRLSVPSLAPVFGRHCGRVPGRSLLAEWTESLQTLLGLEVTLLEYDGRGGARFQRTSRLWVVEEVQDDGLVVRATPWSGTMVDGDEPLVRWLPADLWRRLRPSGNLLSLALLVLLHRGAGMEDEVGLEMWEYLAFAGQAAVPMDRRGRHQCRLQVRRALKTVQDWWSWRSIEEPPPELIGRRDVLDAGWPDFIRSTLRLQVPKGLRGRSPLKVHVDPVPPILDLSEFRSRYQLTQLALAVLLDVSDTFVRYAENGKRALSPSARRRLLRLSVLLACGAYRKHSRRTHKDFAKSRKRRKGRAMV